MIYVQVWSIVMQANHDCSVHYCARSYSRLQSFLCVFSSLFNINMSCCLVLIVYHWVYLLEITELTQHRLNASYKILVFIQTISNEFFSLVSLFRAHSQFQNCRMNRVNAAKTNNTSLTHHHHYHMISTVATKATTTTWRLPVL